MHYNKIKPLEYVLTIVQHTYCGDCMWMKGKITDVYHASGIIRGDDSMHWRMQILSPPWDRNERVKEFPTGFKSVDVPALKLEVDKHTVLATQSPALINEILLELKWLLINLKSNQDICKKLEEATRKWVEPVNQTKLRSSVRYCIASLTWFGSILSIPSRSASVRLTFKILSYARADLVTVDSEQRLGQTLLQIARKLGKKDPRSIRIELRISHEELASMVGTTRPRISVFMQRFRNLGLIELSDEHHLIVKEHKLTAYLASIA